MIREEKIEEVLKYIANPDKLLQVISEYDEDLKEDILWNGILKCAIDKNKDGFNGLLNLYPEKDRGATLGYILSSCVITNNEEGIRSIKAICPDLLEKDMYTYAMDTCVINYDQEAAKKLYPMCPDEFQIEMFGHILYSCVIDDDPKKAFKTLHDCLSDKLTEEMFFKAVLICFENNKPNGVSLLKEAYPTTFNKDHTIDKVIAEIVNEGKEEILNIVLEYLKLADNPEYKIANVILICILHGSKDTLHKLNEICPEDIRPMAYSIAMEQLVNNPENKPKYLKLLNEVCPDDDIVKVFAETIVNNARNRIVNKTVQLLDSNPKAKKQAQSILSTAMCIFVLEKNDTAFDFLYKECPEEYKAMAISNALLTSIREADDQQFEKIKKLCTDKRKDVEVFAFGLVEFAKKGNNKAFFKLKAEIPAKRQEIFYANAIVHAANDNDERSLIYLIKACPKGLRDEIIRQTIVISAIDNKKELLLLIKQTYASFLNLKIIGPAIASCNALNYTKASELIASTFLDQEKKVNTGDLRFPIVSVFTMKGNSKGSLPFIQNPSANRQGSLRSKANTTTGTNADEIPSEEEDSYKKDERQKNELAQKLYTAADTRDEKALVDIKDSCPVNKRESEFVTALVIAAKANNKEAITMLTNNYCESNERKTTMYAEALATCTLENSPKELSVLIDACPEDIKKQALIKAALLYETKEKLAKLSKPINEERNNDFGRVMAKNLSQFIRGEKLKLPSPRIQL